MRQIREGAPDLKRRPGRRTRHLAPIRGKRVLVECGGAVSVGAQSCEAPAFAREGEELPSEDAAIFVLHKHWAYGAPCAPCCAAGEGGHCGELVFGSVQEPGETVDITGMSEGMFCQ